jgi:16S rRNA A1518/A1519 N6-dimethyltransferase RsmA/KsgA/DIM1 with predicted DNA glycosylase/AP lyase activity
LTIGFQQGKEAGLANAQQVLQIGAGELALTISLEQNLNLFICEAPVDL